MKLPDNIKSRLVTKITGVTIHYDTQEAFRISFVTLKAEKGKIHIVRSYPELESIEEFIKSCDIKIPVWLSITGRPVITRILDEDPGSRYLNHILPNAREEDFLVNTVLQPAGKIMISAIRKELFSEITDRLREGGLFIFGCSLGTSALEFLPQNNLLDETEIEVPGYTIRVADSVIRGITSGNSNPERTYQIGDDLLASELLLPFTTALVYLTTRKAYDSSSDDRFDKEQERFVLRKFNRVFFLGSLGLVFLILLLNYLLFSILNNKYEALSGELAYQQVFFAKKDSLQNEINAKTKLVKQMGLSENSSYGYYIDRIAALVPTGITLKELNVNPVDQDLKDNQPIAIQNYILIEGESTGSIILNEWINKLKNYEWLDDIELLRYERTENSGTFRVKIIY